MKQDNNTLPDFIVIGAMRCATTTLYNYLSAHPEIGISRKKETDYYIKEKNYHLGIKWYSNQFSDGYKCYGEVSPNYTKSRDFKGVPERIIGDNPKCKFIYVVRDPVDRFISQYTHSLFMGEKLPEPNKLYQTENWNHILDASLYHKQISEYLRYVEMENICILDYDKLVTQPLIVLEILSKFLNVSNKWDKINVQQANSSVELAHTRKWILELSNNSFIKRYRHYIPVDIINGVKKISGTSKGRDKPEFSADLKKLIYESVKDDSQKFKKAFGLSNDKWLYKF